MNLVLSNLFCKFAMNNRNTGLMEYWNNEVCGRDYVYLYAHSQYSLSHFSIISVFQFFIPFTYIRLNVNLSKGLFL